METKKSKFCGSGQLMGEDLLVDLNLTQLKEILLDAENAQFKKSFVTKDGTKQETLKLKLVKRKEAQGYSTHFLVLNDYIKGENAKKLQVADDLPF